MTTTYPRAYPSGRVAVKVGRGMPLRIRNVLDRPGAEALPGIPLFRRCFVQRYPLAQEYITRAENQAESIVTVTGWNAVEAQMDLRLITDDFAFSPDMVYADLTEASYPGYAKGTVNIADLSLDQDEVGGQVRKQASTLSSFPGPTSGDPVTVYGWILTEQIGLGPPTRIYRVYRFLEPVILANDLQVLNIIPVISFHGGEIVP